jgi:RecA-family ATPase
VTDDLYPLARAITATAPTTSVSPRPDAELAALDGSPRVQTLADFAVKPVRWLWYGRLARGKVTLLDGDPGDNKSTFSLDIAARLTTGRPLPTFDGGERSGLPPSSVAIMTAEDDPGDTVRPRFEAAGGDVTRAAWVPTYTSATDATGNPVETPVTIPDDLDVVRHVMNATGALLLIVDPLSAYIGKVDAHRDNEVRASIRPLADLAAELGFAVLAVRHFTKSGSGRALHRGGGSVAFIGAARVGLTVVRDPDDDAARLLSVSKCNLAPEQPTLRYRIDTDPDQDQPIVEWTGTDERNADDLVNVDDDRPEAEQFIEAMLENGPVPAEEMLEEAKKAGIPRSTLMNAKKRLGVESKKGGFGGGWCWLPPPTEGSTKGPRASSWTVRDSSPESASCVNCDRPATTHDLDGHQRCQRCVSWGGAA